MSSRFLPSMSSEALNFSSMSAKRPMMWTMPVCSSSELGLCELLWWPLQMSISEKTVSAAPPWNSMLATRVMSHWKAYTSRSLITALTAVIGSTPLMSVLVSVGLSGRAHSGAVASIFFSSALTPSRCASSRSLSCLPSFIRSAAVWSRTASRMLVRSARSSACGANAPNRSVHACCGLNCGYCGSLGPLCERACMVVPESITLRCFDTPRWIDATGVSWPILAAISWSIVGPPALENRPLSSVMV
ncbi:hypothetical protein OV079_50990 [Nannocystis pusilla]|uniref:Uncharacterized protein n=1 Tax=Nannocystis pusilla TaxID=889268 RepID=A0A9X3J3X7_9BACT|nr:hypothetical protein [Nannocystis pusilla]MCY1013720.1 hypothetical protein [Nannocystis pusilla]